MTEETPPSAPVPPPSFWTRQRLWIAIGVGAALIVVGIWIVASKLPAFLTSGAPSSPAAATGGTVAAGEGRRIQATLFYVSENGAWLVPATREVAFGATPADQARRIVEAQVQTPEGLVSAIPAGTIVRSVFLTDDHQAFVDLGGAVTTGHTGGSLDEALAVYAIVNAVTVNLPEITGVQILIEGKEVDTLAGHLDLRFPLGKALDWVQKGQ